MKLIKYNSSTLSIASNDTFRVAADDLIHKLSSDGCMLTLLCPTTYILRPFDKIIFDTYISIEPENLPNSRLVVLEGGYIGVEKQTSVVIEGNIESVTESFRIVLVNVTPSTVSVKKDSVLLLVSENHIAINAPSS